MDRLTAMFDAQLKFQQALGRDPRTMDQEQRLAWLQHMALACVAEIHEALDETGWKDWATSRHINETAAFHELRDAWQFITNMMFTVLQCSAEDLARELEAALYDKLRINHERIDSMYDGVASKCTQCRRDLAEVALTQVHNTDGSVDKVLCVCGNVISAEQAAPYMD